ncbi:MAG: type II/IV secretion system protein, partial [Deltaproteobacteria bacterium]
MRVKMAEETRNEGERPFEEREEIPTNLVEEGEEESVWSAFKRELKWQSIKKALTKEIYLPFDPQRKVADYEDFQPLTPAPPPTPVREASPPKTDADRVREFLEAVAHQIGWITPQDLREKLDEIWSSDPQGCGRRLVHLELVSQERIDAALTRSKAEGKAAWEILVIEGNLQPTSFAQALISEREFPLIHRTKGRFSEKLVAEGVVTGEQMRQALQRQKGSGKRLEELLIEMQFVSAEQIARLLADFLELPLIDPLTYPIPLELVRVFPNVFVQEFALLPLHDPERTDNTILIASPEPISPLLTSIIKMRLLCNVEPAICPRNRFLQKLEEYEAQYAQVVKDSEALQSEMEEMRKGELVESEIPIVTGDVAAIDLVGDIIERALRSRATDIHLEPQRGYLRVRLRIDGILYEMMRIGLALANEVVSRIKILADLDITEKRQAQDGHFSITANEKSFDLRVATAPTHLGERIAIRIGDSSRIIADLQGLGLEPEELRKINRLSHRPYGIILATGPTGSGKTTTLYSCLAQLDATSQNIMTIEDPVEYELPGISQISVNYKTNFDFVKGLRAILRHDPDTMMVGEIRDEETAIIAVRAAMTGVLVFSTLHTNDSVGAITRLINLNVPVYLVANALIGVIAQRLVRKICP